MAGPRGAARALARCGSWVRAVAVLAVLLLGCDATPRGRLEVEYQFQTGDGTPLGCEELEASEVELSLFHLPDDVLPYHRATVGCSTTPEGEGSLTIAVDAHEYARLEARLVTYVGTVVRLCHDGETMEARHAWEPVLVETGEKQRVSWLLEGSPGSCSP